MLGSVLESASDDGPAAGSNIWVWSGGAEAGAAGIGDPPHEKPGWYSVCASDISTLPLIRQHAADLSLVSGR